MSPIGSPDLDGKASVTRRVDEFLFLEGDELNIIEIIAASGD